MIGNPHNTPYIDIHTHGQHPRADDIWQVRNMLYQDATGDLDTSLPYTFGLHPWHSLHQHLNKDLFEQLASRSHFVGIGEIGLDISKGANMERQIQLFLDQAQLAEAHQKPVVIHCLKSWDELITLRGIAQPKVPWILHGFRGKPKLAEQMLKHGFYLSFGASLLLANSPSRDSYRMTPINQMFLETDESVESIREIYQTAAIIRKLSLLEIKIYLADNYEDVFGAYGCNGN